MFRKRQEGVLSNDNMMPVRQSESFSRIAASPLIARRYGGANAKRLAACVGDYGRFASVTENSSC